MGTEKVEDTAEDQHGSSPAGTAAEKAADVASQSPGTDELKKAYDELNDQFLRLAADFDNYKKRMAKEQNLRITTAIEQFTVEILEVMDNLERAEKTDDAHLREGLNQIRKLFMAILSRHNIQPIDCLNMQFDPVAHDAVAYVPADAADGVVIDQVARGYRMNDKIIRCAKVAVSKGKNKEA
jgi:molecular chaperone GrpE